MAARRTADAGIADAAAIDCVTLGLLAVGAALVAPTFEAALLPERWHGVAQVMSCLSLGALSLGFHRMAFAQLTALHRSRLAGAIYAMQLVCFVLGLWIVAQTDPERVQMERVALAVSVALAMAASCGVAMTMWVESLRFSKIAAALAPAVLATLMMAIVLLSLRVATARLNVAATSLRLVGEVMIGAGSYVLCLRLGYPALFPEVRNFIARRK